MIEAELKKTEILESETGRFLLELQNSREDISLLIDASVVPEELKTEFRSTVDTLISDLEKQQSMPSQTSTFAFSRHAIIHLLSIVSKKDKEQYHLFETVRNAILRAENSTLGFDSGHLVK